MIRPQYLAATASEPALIEGLTPRRTTLSIIPLADEVLLALERGTDDDQQALGIVLEPGLHVDGWGAPPSRFAPSTAACLKG